MDDSLGDQTQKAKNEKANAAKEGDIPGDEPPQAEIIVPVTPSDIPPAPSNTGSPSTQKKQRDRELPSWAEIGLFYLEIIGICGLIWYCIINIGELNVFKSESATMEKELQLVQSNSVAEQQLAASQLKLMKGQMEAMKRAPELDERAWVFSELPDNSLSFQSNICTITIRFKNTGKTPAVITGSWEAIAFETNKIPPIDDKVVGLGYGMAPNAVNLMPYPLPLAADLQLGANKTIYLYGTTFYDDIFGMEHWTQFCYAISNYGKTMTQPLIHNSYDTEKDDTN